MPTILDEAHDLTGGERQADYGHPSVDLGRTAKFWSAYLGKELTIRDVCWMMVFLKASRDLNKSKRDNLVDACGYLRCVELSDECFADDVLAALHDEGAAQ